MMSRLASLFDSLSELIGLYLYLALSAWSDDKLPYSKLIRSRITFDFLFFLGICSFKGGA